MRDLPGAITDVQQQRRDRVGNCRAPAAQYAVLADAGALKLQNLAELRGVARTHLEEQHRIPGRQVMRVRCLRELPCVLDERSVAWAVGNDPEGVAVEP